LTEVRTEPGAASARGSNSDPNHSIRLEIPMVPTNDEQPTKTPSTDSARTEDRGESHARPSETKKDGVQGEDTYDPAREFNEADRKFVELDKVAAAARAAAPKSEAERKEMIAAEQEGKRPKEEDPALTKARPDSATPRVPGDADRKRG
jgi:hypothetical protein